MSQQDRARAGASLDSGAGCSDCGPSSMARPAPLQNRVMPTGEIFLLRGTGPADGQPRLSAHP